MRALHLIAILLFVVQAAPPAQADVGIPFELKSLVYDGRTVSMHAFVDIVPADRG